MNRIFNTGPFPVFSPNILLHFFSWGGVKFSKHHIPVIRSESSWALHSTYLLIFLIREKFTPLQVKDYLFLYPLVSNYRFCHYLICFWYSQKVSKVDFPLPYEVKWSWGIDGSPSSWGSGGSFFPFICKYFGIWRHWMRASSVIPQSSCICVLNDLAQGYETCIYETTL